MSTPLRRAAIREDLASVPDHQVAEIVDGELYASPRPAPLESGRWAILATYADGAFGRAEPFEAIAIDLLPLWGESRGAKDRPSRATKPRGASTRPRRPRGRKRD